MNAEDETADQVTSDQQSISESKMLLTDGLKCAVCWDYLRAPHTIPCGHTFCLRCLQTLARIARLSRTRTALDRLRFHCPTCRRKTLARPILRRKAAVNYAIKELVDEWLDSPYANGKFDIVLLRSVATQTDESCLPETASATDQTIRGIGMDKPFEVLVAAYYNSNTFRRRYSREEPVCEGGNMDDNDEDLGEIVEMFRDIDRVIAESDQRIRRQREIEQRQMQYREVGHRESEQQANEQRESQSLETEQRTSEEHKVNPQENEQQAIEQCTSVHQISEQQTTEHITNKHQISEQQTIEHSISVHQIRVQETIRERKKDPVINSLGTTTPSDAKNTTRADTDDISRTEYFEILYHRMNSSRANQDDNSSESQTRNTQLLPELLGVDEIVVTTSSEESVSEPEIPIILGNLQIVEENSDDLEGEMPRNDIAIFCDVVWQFAKHCVSVVRHIRQRRSRLLLTLFWFLYGGVIVFISRSFLPWMIFYTLIYFLIIYAELQPDND